MVPVFKITNNYLTIYQLAEVRGLGCKIELSDQSASLVERCREYLDKKLEQQQEPVYGVTTGFGALYNKSIDKDQLAALQKNLVMSHACGTGEVVDREVVDIMVILKIHGLSLGYSGVQLSTVRALVDMYNSGITPVLFRYGSLGASGDLAPLAHLVLPLLGMGEVFFRGERMPSAEAFEIAGIKGADLRSKEGLALLNGTQFMTAHGVVALQQARHLAKAADLIAAISLEGYDGRVEPFFSQLHAIRAHEGQKRVAENILDILRGSAVAVRKKRHVQDPYSFRCIPQVHGATADAIDYAVAVVEREINSVTDNPTLFPDDDMIISGGNFHGQPLALVFDYLATALAELGSISERRVYRLISGHRNLPEFLVANPGLNSGFMIPQYTAASLVSSNKQLCSPTSVDSIPSSNEQEDHVSMGANGATRLLQITSNLSTILAIELLTAAQALEFRRPLRSSDHIEAVIESFRKEVPFVEDDRIMYTDIEKSRQFLLKSLL